MKKIFVLLSIVLIMVSCSGSKSSNSPSTNTTVTKEDSSSTAPPCTATVKKQIILKDTMITIPSVELANKEVEKKINTVLDIEKISGYSLEDLETQKKEAQEGIPGGLASVSYEITKNADCALSFQCWNEGCGAYCSVWTKLYSFDINTGTLLKIEDIIQPSSIAALLKLCNIELNKNIEAAKKEHKGDLDDDILQSYKGHTFRKDNLNEFCITESGLKFNYNYDFPHVILFAEPSRVISISKDELKDMLVKHQYGL